MTPRRWPQRRHVAAAAAVWVAATAAVTAVSWAGVDAVGRAVDGGPVTVMSATGVARSAPPAPRGATMPATRRTAPQPSTATFADGGGQLTVTCSGTSVRLASATPANGYQVTVEEAGPVEVDVRLSGGPPAPDLVAACRAGVPVGVPPPRPAGGPPGARPGPPPGGGRASAPVPPSRR